MGQSDENEGISTDNGNSWWLRSNNGTITAVQSEGANMEHGAAKEEGPLREERWQRAATKRVTCPSSCKTATNV